MDEVYQKEQEHLARTQKQYQEIIAENQELFEALPGLYPGDNDVLNDLLLQTHNRIIRLERGLEKPYFARIDFVENEHAVEKYYIGKIGVLNSEEQIITLDWRAPVSTLYYDSNVGEVSYDSPSGMVYGRLKLKRQLEIEKGQLLSYNDVDTVANDDLLRPYLGVNADNRLKNIIATIQTEQNRIIREKLEKNVIVQGVAGSGKTTVALHRIAYLVYNNRGTIQPGQYMVIGPNRFFINYISSVLPDLDVDSVPQYTYPELVREIVGEPFELTDPSLRLAQVVAGSYNSGVERHKTSMAYKAALDRFLHWFESTILPPGGFDLRGFPILSGEDLQEGWERAQSSPGDSIRSRVEHCILYLSGLVKNREILLENQLSQHFRELYQPGAGVTLDKLHKDRAWIEKELETGCRKSLWKFFSKAEVKTLALYRLFLTESQRFLDPVFLEGEALKKQTIKNLRGRKLDNEDLPALLYLKDRLLGRDGKGMEKWKHFRHGVIDEAQDFGEFDLYALQKVMSGATFTVVGDLAQSIYGYRSIESWSQVLQWSFDQGAVLCEMEKCYRTTVEVMEAANRVTRAMGLNPAQPVIRHGPPVGLHQVGGKNRAKLVAELVRNFEADGYQSIALLCKTADEQAGMVEELAAFGLAVHPFTGETGQYEGGVCAMTGYLSKGLEFDGVILWDASEAVYDSSKKTDLHLLYVAMTRPLHRLELFSDGAVCTPLREL